jgi:hypothetical protein
MSQWTDRILSHFTADLTRLWVACDPDDVLLDEKLLAELRSRGFEVMLYEDPFAFRAEFEERYRGAWDRGEAGPAPSLVLHLRGADQNVLPWDIVHHGRVARLSLAELFPGWPTARSSRWSRSTLRHCSMPMKRSCSRLAARTSPRTSSSNTSTNSRRDPSARPSTSGASCCGCTLQTAHCRHCLPSMPPGILQGKGLFADQPVAAWLSSKSVLLRVVQDAWYRYLTGLGLDGSRTGEPPPPDYVAKIEIPFDHSDVQVLVDSMFLDGTLHPMAVHSVPAAMPSWIKAGIVQDPAALQALVLKGVDGLIASIPSDGASHKDWSEFAKRYGEILARAHGLPGAEGSEQLLKVRIVDQCAACAV